MEDGQDGNFCVSEFFAEVDIVSIIDRSRQA